MTTLLPKHNWIYTELTLFLKEKKNICKWNTTEHLPNVPPWKYRRETVNNKLQGVVCVCVCGWGGGGGEEWEEALASFTGFTFSSSASIVVNNIYMFGPRGVLLTHNYKVLNDDIFA